MQLITLLILIIFVFYHIRDNNVFRPDFIYAIVMLGGLFIAGLRLSSYQSSYEWWFYLCIYMSVLLFCISYYATKRYRQSEKKKEKIRNERGFCYNALATKRIIVILWLLVIGSVLVMWAILGAPPAISMENERSSYYVSGVGTVYLLNMTLFSLLVFDNLQKKSLPNKVVAFLGLTIIFCVVLMANKFQIITLAIVFLTMRSILNKGQSFKSVLLLTVAAVLLFVGMYEILYSKMYSFTTSDTLYWYRLNLPRRLSFLSQPYLYIANNFENLYHFMTTQHHNTLGYSLLYNLSRSLSLCNVIFGNQIAEYSKEFANSLQMSSMNTGSALMTPYNDFGVIGILIYSILIGAVSGFAEKKLIEKKNFKSVFFYSYVITASFLSFLSENFFSKPLVVNLIAVIALSPFIDGKIHIVIGSSKSKYRYEKR